MATRFASHKWTFSWCCAVWNELVEIGIVHMYTPTFNTNKWSRITWNLLHGMMMLCKWVLLASCKLLILRSDENRYSYDHHYRILGIFFFNQVINGITWFNTQLTWSIRRVHDVYQLTGFHCFSYYRADVHDWSYWLCFPCTNISLFLSIMMFVQPNFSYTSFNELINIKNAMHEDMNETGYPVVITFCLIMAV